MDGIDIELRRSRRKTISLEITREAQIIVRAPLRMPTAAIRQFVDSKRTWIERRLAEARERQAQRQDRPCMTQEELSLLFERARAVLPERTAYFAAVIGVDYGRITIRRQKTRWGSCSSKGNLSFNCMLMLLPPTLQDYVVVHELCHRREMNHSARFWEEVARVLPDYKQRRAQLRQSGDCINR